MRQWFLPTYIGMVTRLLPKVNETGGVDLDEAGEMRLESVLADVRATLDAVELGEATYEDLEAAMLGAGRHN
jgi:hypothetical protein